jgi:type I restriction enzyme S subunit
LIRKELVINQQLHAFVVGEQILPEWLAFNLENQERYMTKIATQTTIRYLNKDACESVPIIVPEKSEQQRLVEKVLIISNKLSMEQQIVLKLKKQKLGLMHDLLTGKVPFKIDPVESAHDS